MNYALFLARKISLTRKGRGGAPAVKVAVIAVALSVIVMMMAVAIVFGFKREIRNKVIGFNSHISLYVTPESEDDSNLITLTPTLKKILNDKEYVEDYSLEVSIPAILKTSDQFKGVYLKSCNGATINRFIKENLEEGSLQDYTKEGNDEKIVISRIAADKLNLKAGDKIDTYFLSGALRMRRLEVAGIFNSHFDSYDDVFIYGSMPLIQKLAEIGNNEGTSVSVQVDDFARLQEYTQDLSHTLMSALASGMVYKIYRVENTYSQGAGFFSWLALLDTNVIVILVLMTIVACATLISGMLIIILDKKLFIALLRALGTPTKSVRRVFIFLALKIAVIGLLIGNAISLGLLYAQDKWHLLPLDAETYYIDFVPVEINYTAIVLLNAATILLIYLALILPSSFASRISPAEVLKTE